MTIKKRLFISNILMMIIPILVVIITNIIFSLITWAYLGDEFFEKILKNKDGESFFARESFIFYGVPAGSIIVGTMLIITCINKFLTRFVFSKIAQPLNMLSSGVQQIKEGNLNHRINYSVEDEFKPICEDFNNMAERLLEMVNERQKDEKNRRELIAGISHDLRTPLTSIKAYIEGIEKGIASTPEIQTRYINTIKSKTNDLEYIINQLFLFSKLDIGDFPFRSEKVDIGNELSSFISNHEKEYSQKGLSVSLNENVENIYVGIDVVQFRNVIHNILSNSVKYNNSGQAETIISCRTDGKYVKIILTDNGLGVSEEILEKLFDIFFREDSSRNNSIKGSGLGLAISKKIIESSNGSIKAQNISSGGLAVTITLPILKQEE